MAARTSDGIEAFRLKSRLEFMRFSFGNNGCVLSLDRETVA
jgi:hypothetical protein